MGDPDYELAAQLRSVATRLTRQIRKQNIRTDFSNSEILTMALLDQYGKLLPSDLAELERVSKQAISQIINRLFEAGYVQRDIIETDKRKVVISLTEKGSTMLAETRRIKEEWLAKAMSEVFSNEELALIKAFLPFLQRITDYNG